MVLTESVQVSVIVLKLQTSVARSAQKQQRNFRSCIVVHTSRRSLPLRPLLWQSTILLTLSLTPPLRLLPPPSPSHPLPRCVPLHPLLLPPLPRRMLVWPARWRTRATPPPQARARARRVITCIVRVDLMQMNRNMSVTAIAFQTSVRYSHNFWPLGSQSPPGPSAQAVSLGRRTGGTTQR